MDYSLLPLDRKFLYSIIFITERDRRRSVDSDYLLQGLAARSSIFVCNIWPWARSFWPSNYGLKTKYKLVTSDMVTSKEWSKLLYSARRTVPWRPRMPSVLRSGLLHCHHCRWMAQTCSPSDAYIYVDTGCVWRPPGPPRRSLVLTTKAIRNRRLWKDLLQGREKYKKQKNNNGASQQLATYYVNFSLCDCM